MTQVVPAIIPKNLEQMKKEINLVANFAHTVQIDISDGIFTPFKTWPYNGLNIDFFDKLKGEEIGWPEWEELDFEIHLMIKDPENVLEDWIKTGVSTIVAHIESTNNFQKVIDMCKEKGVSIWLAFKPSTDISSILFYIPQVDGVQCMGSDALGQHGASLEDKSLKQIKKLREMYPESMIGIDIGVTIDTKNKILSAGASKLICGSAILDADNPREVYRELEGF